LTTKEEDGSLGEEVSSRLDELFGDDNSEAAPVSKVSSAAVSVADNSRITGRKAAKPRAESAADDLPADSPIRNLKALVFSIDWEITDDTMVDFLAETNRLLGKYKNDKILTLFLKRSRTGKAIRAVAENDRAAMLLGIDVRGIIAFTFFISSALGGAAGILYGLYFDSLAPDMGRSIELKGLAVIILGGMGSIPGAILGGLAFGLSEVLTVAVTGTSNLRDAVAFMVLFAILLLRPSGLLGRARMREA